MLAVASPSSALSVDDGGEQEAPSAVFLRRAVLNLWGAPLPAAVTAATIAIVVFLFGAFLLTGQNTYRALVGWAGRVGRGVAYLYEWRTGRSTALSSPS